MVVKSINCLAQSYLSNLFAKNTQIIHLKSVGIHLSMLKFLRKKERLYKNAEAWNNLPAEAKQTASLVQIKTLLLIFSCGYFASVLIFYDFHISYNVLLQFL